MRSDTLDEPAHCGPLFPRLAPASQAGDDHNVPADAVRLGLGFYGRIKGGEHTVRCVAMAKKAAFWAVPDGAEIHAILMDRIDIQRRGVGLIVGVVNKDGRRIVAYGKTSKSDDRTPDGDTLFEIGSVTKTFTSLLLWWNAAKSLLMIQPPTICPQA
jgi:CubicO group peptidase (beta-lactamase class C family)